MAVHVTSYNNIPIDPAVLIELYDTFGESNIETKRSVDGRPITVSITTQDPEKALEVVPVSGYDIKFDQSDGGPIQYKAPTVGSKAREKRLKEKGAEAHGRGLLAIHKAQQRGYLYEKVGTYGLYAIGGTAILSILATGWHIANELSGAERQIDRHDQLTEELFGFSSKDMVKPESPGDEPAP